MYKKIAGYLKENDKIIFDFTLIISKKFSIFFQSDAKPFSHQKFFASKCFSIAFKMEAFKNYVLQPMKVFAENKMASSH